MKIRQKNILAIPLVLIVSLMVMVNVQAQEVQVNSADPASAEQATVNLDVTVAGKGFDNSAAVRFLITDTEDLGGIIVNSVRVRGSKKLIANIDVGSEAAVDDFDIEVVMLGGRKGKGTTLFAVKAKPETLPATEVDNDAGYDLAGPMTELSSRLCMVSPLQPTTGTGTYECEIGETLTLTIAGGGNNWQKEPAGRKGGDGRYCDHLNSLVSFDLKPTRYWYKNFGCAEGVCEIKIGQWAFRGDTAPWPDAHPFHDFHLPDVGLLRVRAWADLPVLADDLNPFAADRVLDIHTLSLQFDAAGKGKSLATCQATFDVDNPAAARPLLITECIGTECKARPSP